MKKNIVMIIALIAAISCITGIIVSATTDALPGQAETTQAVVEKTDVNSDKIYFAYYNEGSQKGAVAFCLDNDFVGLGQAQKDIQLCTKNEDGTYSLLHTISKDNLTAFFAGKQEYTLSPSENLSELLWGLSDFGITYDCDKTNVIFALENQSIEKGKTYYIYIPEDYFVDSEGVGNKGAYIEITQGTVNSYTGKLCSDIETIAGGIYDLALFGVESIGSILS